MSFLRRILNRITGSSPSARERKVVYKLIRQFGDRSLIPGYHGSYSLTEVITSLKIMRTKLNEALANLSPEAASRGPIERIRETLHHFEHFVVLNSPPEVVSGATDASIDPEWFVPAAPETHRVVGCELTVLARMHKITLPESLSGDYEAGFCSW